MFSAAPGVTGIMKSALIILLLSIIALGKKLVVAVRAPLAGFTDYSNPSNLDKFGLVPIAVAKG